MTQLVQRRRKRLAGGWTFILAACIVVLPEAGVAQARASTGQRSTKQGVYNREQWLRGRDVYAGMCAGCHPAITHVGPQFTTSWAGKKLSDLFGFLRERMPKNEPGSLSEQDYIDVMSYMLRLNGMPAGIDELPADSVALTKIRIDSSRVGPPSTDLRDYDEREQDGQGRSDAGRTLISCPTSDIRRPQGAHFNEG